MKRKEIKEALKDFLRDISFGNLGTDFWIKRNKVLNALSTRLYHESFETEDIDNYLNSVIGQIDSFNKYQKRQKRSQASYSGLLSWANKEERISAFLLEKGIRKKIKKNRPIRILAGFESSKEKIDSLKEFKKLSFSYKGKDYRFIYTKRGKIFFFSSENQKILIQDSSGKIISYKRYVQEAKGKFLTKIEIYRAIKKDLNKNDTMQSFLIYMRQKIAKARRKRWDLEKK